MSRVANFTSSSIHKLMSKGRGNWSVENVGAPFKSYVQEKIYEARTGVSMSKDVNAKPAIWGWFMEQWVFENKMGLSHQLISKTRYKHDDLPWSGMPDTILDDSISDIKNPYTLLSFCQKVDALESVETFKDQVPEYYWQLVSNSILAEKEYAEIFIHVPYEDELADIREFTEQYDGDQNKVAFINWATDAELPHIKRDHYYKDLNHIRFKVPEEDKELLTERVKMATELLNKAI